MSFLKFLDQINTDTFSEEQKDQFMDRKDALGKMTDFSKKLALSAIPMGAFAAFASPAMAQSADDDFGILNFALTLEYLEKEFYIKGLDSGVISSADTTIFQQVSKHETAHVDFLKDAISTAGGTPVDKPTFDFTGGKGSGNGPFDPFNDYPTFQVLSMGFEDTGVRAYKGQAGFLSNKDYLTAALQIHSVEARHASEVRRLAAKNGVAVNAKGWITGAGTNSPQVLRDTGIYASDNGFYNVSEGNTVQGGADTANFISSTVASEAFDEPLDMSAVINIANTFIVDNS